MACECYQIGGRFIAEDPDCPAHGVEAQRLEAEAEEESRAKDERIATLERRLAALGAEVEELRRLVRYSIHRK